MSCKYIHDLYLLSYHFSLLGSRIHDLFLIPRQTPYFDEWEALRSLTCIQIMNHYGGKRSELDPPRSNQSHHGVHDNTFYQHEPCFGLSATGLCSTVLTVSVYSLEYDEQAIGSTRQLRQEVYTTQALTIYPCLLWIQGPVPFWPDARCRHLWHSTGSRMWW